MSHTHSTLSLSALAIASVPGPALVVVGHEHRLADPGSLAKMLEVVKKAGIRVLIRPEKPGDYAPIRDILIAAFANHPYSHQTEHLIVDALRADDALIVSLVAVVGGQVVGHIAFSPAKINGMDCKWFGLGPVAVAPAHQRHGIGKGLVNAGLEAIRNLGAEGCVLVGDPAFYRRFGFQNNPPLRMEGVPPEVVMCLPMGDQVPEGEVTHHPAFFVGE